MAIRKKQPGLHARVDGLGKVSIQALHDLRDIDDAGVPGKLRGRSGMSKYIWEKLKDMKLIEIFPWIIGSGENWRITKKGRALLTKTIK